MNDIGLYFEYEGQVIQLPVNPEKLEISYRGNNKNVEIIQLGEVSILKKKKLGTIKFESWFPYESWWPGIRTKGQFESVDFYKNFFTNLQNIGKPCRFIVTGINYNTLVSIEKFNYYNQGGDYEDCYYSLELKEYVPYQVKILTPTTLSNSDTANNNELPVIGSMDKPTINPEEITVGCTVVLNGTLHKDSYGNGPGQTKSNFKCKVNFIKKGNAYPYHVTTESGGWLGWVKESDLKLS